MKKTLLFLSLLLTSLGGFAYDACIDGIYYNFSGTNATVTYQYASGNTASDYAGDIVIPATVTYNGTTYSVTTIGYFAFNGCANVTSIVIPNGVTKIDPCAFQGCSGLTSIDTPSSMRTILGGAFQNCTGLTSITIPEGVTTIGERAFQNCKKLPSITIPSSVVSIGEDAFYACDGLDSIIVKNGNTVYDSRNDCNAIIETASNTLIWGSNNTNIPEGVTKIFRNAFCGRSGLVSITIPNSVTSIGNYTFYGCSSLSSVSIPNSVNSIGSGAFCNCI